MLETSIFCEHLNDKVLYFAKSIENKVLEICDCL